MLLGIPVINKHKETLKLVLSLKETIGDPEDFAVAVIDNDSDTPYTREEFPDLPFDLVIVHNRENKGFYYPLKQLFDTYNIPLIGLCHNDMVFYEKGWDLRMGKCFNSDEKLSLIGLCGSNQVDIAGGRGTGTMCFFRGDDGQKQSAGRRITDLQPAAILDSMFMMFRSLDIPLLKIDEEITLCHFYDKIWSLRLIENGKHVAVLGIEVDHWGGVTSVSEPKYREHTREWLVKHNIPEQENGDLGIYQEAERRFLTEYRQEKEMMPMHIDGDYNVCKP